MTKRLLAGWSLGLLAQLSAIGLLLTSAWLISRAAEHPPVLYLMIAIVSVRAFGVARSVLRYCERLLTHDAAFRLLNEHRLALYITLDEASPAGLPHGRRGDVVSRVVHDVDAFQDRLLRVRIPRSIALVSSLLVTALMAVISPATAAVMTIAILFLVAVIPLIVSFSNTADSRETAAFRGDLASEVAQAVVAAPDLIAYGVTSAVRDRVRGIDAGLARAQRRFVWLSGLSSALVFTTMGAVVVASARIGVPAVADGRLDRVLLAVLVLAPLGLIEPLDQLGATANIGLSIKESLARVSELQKVRPSMDEPIAYFPLPDRWDLEVHDVRLGWNAALEAAPVDFTLSEGDVLGITGRSGSGKSTLACTLLKLISPKGGRIELGGGDIRFMRGLDVRSRIGLMEQDSHIFDTSIRENLRIGKPDASDDELAAALNRAGLSALVQSLPLAIETIVGENGSRLSGGERQRLALARLLLADRKILIFDEPTEHLDELTAESLLDDILRLSPDHSVVIITHSHAVLDRLDNVLRLDERVFVDA
ncbi:MAG: thiol reductant ABC exporter subunit CydC [Aeromicrobium sp.]